MKIVKIGAWLLMTVLLLAAMTFSVGADTIVSGEYEYTIVSDKAVLTKYLGNDRFVEVPDEIDGYKVVKLIGTFSNNTNVKIVKLKSGITTIGDHTFFECENLRKVILSDTVEVLGEWAFAYSGIKTIYLPAKTVLLCDFCFYGCSDLKFVESAAESLDNGRSTLHLGEQAFADSSVRVIKTDNPPNYYDNTFNSECWFVADRFGSFIYSIPWLVPFVKFNLQLPPVQRAGMMTILIIALGVIVVFVVFLARLVLRLLGKNNAAKYTKYSENTFLHMGIENSLNNIIHYKKIVFVQDKIRNILNKLIIVLAIISYFLLFSLAFLNLDFGIKNIILNSLVNAVVVILASGVFIWLCVKLSGFIAKKMKRFGKLRVRVRRVARGGKHNDQ